MNLFFFFINKITFMLAHKCLVSAVWMWLVMASLTGYSITYWSCSLTPMNKSYWLSMNY